MRSPFEDPGQGEESHLVLTNAAGELSLWPAFADVPEGWTVTLPATGHRACLDHLERAAAPSASTSATEHTAGLRPEPSGATQ
ncbi:MbtH family protein [Streptomyces sp. NPDC020799]|uniref:MbtH family protein n=1 Tax=unclassified Streptomyces TaxID=2593676 RepID=UPI003403F033